MDQEPDDRERPEDRVHQGEQGCPADKQIEAEEPRRAQLLPEAAGVPHVDQPGLQIALVPARSLLDPVHKVAVSLFERFRIENCRASAGAIEANAKIGVLGHVEGVPAPQLNERLAAEVIRRAAQGHGRSALDQPRQHLAEPHRVLAGEPAGQEILVCVVVRQPGLQTDHLGDVAAECHHGAFELQWFRPILDVVDGYEFAACLRETNVARLGLGFRWPIRNANDLNMGVGRNPDRRGVRLGVVLLEEQLHVESILRVVEPLELVEDLSDDLRLPVCRHEDRVDRQVVVGNASGFLVRHGDDSGFTEAAPKEPDAIHEGGDVEDRRERNQQRDCRQRAERQDNEKGNGGRPRRAKLPAGDGLRRRKFARWETDRPYPARIGLWRTATETEVRIPALYPPAGGTATPEYLDPAVGPEAGAPARGSRGCPLRSSRSVRFRRVRRPCRPASCRFPAHRQVAPPAAGEFRPHQPSAASARNNHQPRHWLSAMDCDGRGRTVRKIGMIALRPEFKAHWVTVDRWSSA